MFHLNPVLIGSGAGASIHQLNKFKIQKAVCERGPDPQWVRAFAGTTLILIWSGGPKAHDHSPEGHVIPAKAGIHPRCVPATAGTAAYVTLIS